SYSRSVFNIKSLPKTKGTSVSIEGNAFVLPCKINISELSCIGRLLVQRNRPKLHPSLSNLFSLSNSRREEATDPESQKFCLRRGLFVHAAAFPCTEFIAR